MFAGDHQEALMKMDRQGLIDFIANSGYIFTLPQNQQGVYLFGKTKNNRAVCLVSLETNDGCINRDVATGLVLEIRQSGLFVPFLCFGYSSLVSAPDLFTFAQIPWCFEGNNPILRMLRGMNMRGHLRVLGR